MFTVDVARRCTYNVGGHGKGHPGGQKRTSNTSEEDDDRQRKKVSQDKTSDSKTEVSVCRYFGVVRLKSAAEYDA
ncbi:hypothetical protein PILCRDRAFT_824837 [Piloderma croceum F 1598]|uniref:Uncharacterized protein n=1 Tax=Piloderma croceum (strain F 1598) TaxID=765440 RepID=A0A0C3AVU9_PILCF|nr:hypothetical protein PILCRDRAFT_824837 [Piloderma croceum F 1598]